VDYRTPTRKYFKGNSLCGLLNIDHPNYDETWQSRAIWKYLKNIKPAVMLVGGWYDTEDPQGLLRQFGVHGEKFSAGDRHAVMGPWNHGGFARGNGIGSATFRLGSNTGQYYREKIEFPFFFVLLEGQGRRQVSEGLCVSNGRK